MGKQKPWSCVCLPDLRCCVCVFFFFFSPSLFWNKHRFESDSSPVHEDAGISGLLLFFACEAAAASLPTAFGLRAGRQDVFSDADLAWQGSRENFLSLLGILR